MDMVGILRYVLPLETQKPGTAKGSSFWDETSDTTSDLLVKAVGPKRVASSKNLQGAIVMFGGGEAKNMFGGGQATRIMHPGQRQQRHSMTSES
jgi:hypothetical protein